MTDILSDKIVKTRKSHCCFACGRLFPAGTKMERQKSIDDRDFSTVYICATCQKLQVKVGDELCDSQQDFFPEFCVSDALLENKYKSPEEWLETLEKKGVKNGNN